MTLSKSNEIVFLLGFKCDKFGPPEVLELKEIDQPAPKADEILVKTHTSSMNALDISFRNGAKLIFGLVRLVMSGIRKPRIKVSGLDIAGEVVSVGKDVSRFKKGHFETSP